MPSLIRKLAQSGIADQDRLDSENSTVPPLSQGRTAAAIGGTRRERKHAALRIAPTLQNVLSNEISVPAGGC